MVLIVDYGLCFGIGFLMSINISFPFQILVLLNDSAILGGLLDVATLLRFLFTNVNSISG